jgi:hypothetical protein
VVFSVGSGTVFGLTGTEGRFNTNGPETVSLTSLAFVTATAVINLVAQCGTGTVGGNVLETTTVTSHKVKEF